ncbi:hypothetical protein [Pseudomonas aeruginosa]|uniref:hypothetical protein n=1 Tax=Pseudomonas aeruginosa TaxID=287 RepID=UPI000BB7FB99|nr:hypothetical protein [Pseudomonas aeruginosa]MCO3292064.1 hypothetical protein [Pseudomonas aeruginosa]MEE3522951.1 hypothetical protein [Pseudomonas aeruginosa]NBK29904.1 hypothetical protein [Pseudomonas aeruginosa]NBY84219.1 hypothetical protein [Pseudomonas aeruginosa]NPX03903.1 hypothetical protein [Pseudomonas aeruginosa]
MWLWQNYLKYRVALRKQAKAQEALDKEFPPDEPEELTNSWMSDYVKRADELLHWKWIIHTEYLRNKADVLGAQMPDITEPGMYGRVEWDDNPKQPYYLTEKGIRAARDAIRAEENHRRQAGGYWFGMVLALITAVTGLISAFKG